MTARGAERAVDPPMLLQLMWLASPALPIGGFSYSEGLEPAVESGRVLTEAQARDWLVDQLRLGLARSDMAVVAQAVRAWANGDLDRVDALNAWTLTTRETAEMRQQTEQMGRSMLEWLRNRPHDARIDALRALRPAPAFPVSFALAAALAGAGPRETLLAFAFGWAENMVQAAIKAVPLGQSAGQRILAALADAIPDAVGHALLLDDTSRQSFVPMLAILSARHETQYTRIFRS